MSLKIRQTQPSSETTAAAEEDKKSKRKILVVDDEKLLLTTLRNLLDPLYDVRVANSGNEAMGILADGFEPDVILADQRMPQMTGAQLLAASTSIVPKAIHIVLTGYTDVSDIVESINIGHVYLFITKPWDDDELIDALKAAVSHHDLLTQNRELRQAIGSLEGANARLETLNREKNELIGIVAHDLRNPLTAMLGMSELMMRYPEDTVRKGYPERIFSAGKRLVDLINTLLDVNVMEDGSIQATIRQVNIGAIVAAVAEPFQIAAEEKGITVHLDCEADATALADETMISQVLGNLLSNAIKFSPLGSEVFVRVYRSIDSHSLDGTASSEAASGAAEVIRLDVRDAGPGITAADHTKLFQKFTKLSARPTAGEYSTGLGLAIVKKLVKVMHGHVWCESQLGEGACFSVILPSANTTS